CVRSRSRSVARGMSWPMSQRMSASRRWAQSRCACRTSSRRTRLLFRARQSASSVVRTRSGMRCLAGRT
ncbi:hypothetical protein IWW35_004655, partial [Coemansia sp. RSA 1878]